MKREDAFYFQHLLLLGITDGYYEWLSYYLEIESPLSDIVLELSLSGSDLAKVVPLLHNFCLEESFDKSVSHDKLRLFFKNAYYSNKMSKGEISSSMFRLACNIGDPFDYDFDMELWGSMYYLSYYFSLAEDGILSWDRFDLAFFSYLNDGIPVDFEHIWN